MKKTKHNTILKLAMLIASFLLAVIFTCYTFFTGRKIRNNNHEYLINDTQQCAENIEYVIEDGYKNISTLSELVSQTLTSPDVNISNYQKLINDSVFDFVEFADKNGFNHNITGGVSDAKDRQYYLDALQGHSGMEIVFNSRATHENLLMFYSPVYYEHEIIGSLIGVYQATNKLPHYITVNYFGENATSYLCTSTGKLFASSIDLDTTVKKNIEDVIDISPEDKTRIFENIKQKKATSFFLENNKSSGYAVPISDGELWLIQLYPSSVNIRMMHEMFMLAFVMLLAVLLVYVGHQMTVYHISKKQENVINNQLALFRSMADIYHSMHLINMMDFSIVEYKTNELIHKIVISDMTTIEKMKTVMQNTVTDTYLDMALMFSDLTTLSKRLQNKKIISMELLGEHVGWIRMSFITLEADSDGFPINVIVTIQDIDEKKKREIALFSQTELAQHANEAKSRFLANMSHEIRTPLNAIIGLSTMILRESTEANIKVYASDVENSSQTLLSLVNDILDLSKIESEKMDLYPVEYDFSSLLNDVIVMVSTKAASKHLEVNLNIDKHLPSKLYGDDIRIRQILVNLMNNAVKYTEKGSITLNVTGTQSEDTILLHIEVIDTGIGIKEEELGKLFSAFERLDEKRNRNIEGTGLGMSITTQLLKLMGSSLQVKSEYEKGSTFYFDLTQGIRSTDEIGDLEKRISDQVTNYQYSAKFIAPDAKILVVDDNRTNIKVIRSLLKETYIQLDEADCGEDALKLIANTKYQVIFLDHMMPGMDGIEVLKRMKSDQSHANQTTPVIALTANAINGAREKYLQAGFVDYLSKPINSTKLEQMLYLLLKDEWILTPEEQEKYESSIAANSPTNDIDLLPSEDALPDIDGIDWEYALLKLKNVSTIIDIVKDYIIMSSKDLSDLQGKLDVLMKPIEDPVERAEAFRQYRVKVHAMKSTTAMFGALQVSALAKTLEYAAKVENIDLIMNFTALFEEEWTRLSQSLKESFGFASNTSNTTKEAIDSDFLSEQLNKLSEAIQDLDVDVSDQIMEQLLAYSYEGEQQAKIEQLSVAVRALDIDKVQEIVEHWNN